MSPPTHSAADHTQPVQPAEGRVCGACTMCCKVMGIEELDKPAGQLCGHCATGKGCTVYETRPSSCREFICVWLMEGWMPHRMRPDQTKVVLAAEADPPRLIAYCDPANPLAWKRGPVYDLLKKQAIANWGTGTTVVARAGARMWLLTPRNDVDLGELPPNTAYAIEEKVKGGPFTVVRPPPSS